MVDPLGAFVHTLAHGAVPICPPDALFPLELLQLPDLRPGLALFQRLFASPPSSLPMWRRDRYEDALFPNGNGAESMYDRNAL